MVVPPALAVTYTLYWKRTTEAGAFWGMVLGFAGGLIWYALTHFVVRRARRVDRSGVSDDADPTDRHSRHLADDA